MPPLSLADQQIHQADMERLWNTVLASKGWGTEAYDLCWLDCPYLGRLKTHRGREICLCAEHAIMLEQGKIMGSYLNITPPHSRATEWPWRPAQPVDVVPEAS